MTDDVKILDAHGMPMAPSRASMLAGGGRTPYDAADIYDQHMAEWRPYLWSPDGELNIFRDRIVSRVRDLVRNDGWASGAVTRILDNSIGANFRPISKPDYRALAAYTGNTAFDATWAEEYGNVVDAHYRLWAEDAGRYSDAMRKMTVPQMLRLGFRHKIVDGDALAQLLWLPQRVGRGRAIYATAVQIVDPDRLSNPQMRFDIINVRGGVEIDEYGAAVAYHIRQAHAGDWFNAEKANTWARIERETDWGRPIIVHDYDLDRAQQHRGGTGVLGPVVHRLKALIKYDGAELDAAILNAIFAAYVESPNDPELVESALGNTELSAYQRERAAYHDQKRLSLGGARMPILFPGEKIQAVTAARPTSNFADFEKAVLRNFASAAGLSAQQVSQDWSDVNYSSARGALLEAWKTLDRRRTEFAIGFANPIRGAWLEEAHEIAELPLPKGAPSFMECRTAYMRATWLGPGRGWIDPVAEREGSVLGMEAGLSTLEMECADQDLDWEENLDQRARELAAFKKRGLEPPASWLANRPASVARAPGEGKDTA
ncbi:phage portal protein [uncultured Pseudacidovorax sp.]|uniref:phage portal protein n=1 Tax=uncultured Pseudacidovorax sp. TaxID=679313 RepID=UPI0025E94536|nr:phage portal protein [uncultured Pseudacidovorax sp.]